MKANTRLFGEIDIADDRIIVLKEGIIGFPDLQKFALIYDEEKEEKGKIMWLQSMDDPAFAMPVMNPLEVLPSYHPTISEDNYNLIGKVSLEDVFVLVTITVPKDIRKMSVNLKAPFIINMKNLEGMQIIVEDDYPVKFMMYDLLRESRMKENSKNNKNSEIDSSHENNIRETEKAGE